MELCFENIESFVIFFVVIFCQNNSQFNEIYEIINVFDEINFSKWSKTFDTKICKLNKIFFARGKSRHVFFVFSIQKQRIFLRCTVIEELFIQSRRFGTRFEIPLSQRDKVHLLMLDMPLGKVLSRLHLK